MTDIWQLIVETNTLNFLIVFAIISFFVYKMNIKQKLESMRSDIKNYVDESSNEKNVADKALEDIKVKVKNLPSEIDKIKKSTQNSVESIEKKIEAEIKDKMLDIDNNAKRIMNLETKKFKSKLTGILTETSVNLASENALKQLSENPELHNKYIDEAIGEIDRITL